MFAPDPDGARIGLPMPPDADVRLAVPQSRGDAVDRGELAVVAEPATATTIGDVDVLLAAGEARTLVLRWDDPELGPQENTVHLHCPGPDEVHGPGRTEIA